MYIICRHKNDPKDVVKVLKKTKKAAVKPSIPAAKESSEDESENDKKKLF
jgi:hypothetical protein